jgi:hypothetical protein
MKSFKVEYLFDGLWVVSKDSPVKASCRKSVTAMCQCGAGEENNGTVKIRLIK